MKLTKTRITLDRTDLCAVSGVLPWTAPASNAHRFIVRALECADRGDLEGYAACLSLAAECSMDALRAVQEA